MTQTQAAPGQAAPAIPKPVPRYGKDTAPYWEHMREHRLHIQKCASCGKLRMYPRPMCDACYSLESEWVPASGKGKVYSWCVVYQPVHPAFKDELPFAIVEVELDEGVRIRSTVIDVAPDQLAVGMPLEIVYDDVSDSVTLPKFKRAN
jgi:uncharacterized OB-fold protein